MYALSPFNKWLYRISSHLEQKLASYSLETKSSLLLILVKVYWCDTMPTYLHVVCGSFPEELSSTTESVGPQG